MAMPRLIESVLQAHPEWKENTKQTYEPDANAVLEALVLDFADAEKVDGLMKKHGFLGNYKAVFKHLFKHAKIRHKERVKGK